MDPELVLLFDNIDKVLNIFFAIVLLKIRFQFLNDYSPNIEYQFIFVGDGLDFKVRFDQVMVGMIDVDIEDSVGVVGYEMFDQVQGRQEMDIEYEMFEVYCYQFVLLDQLDVIQQLSIGYYVVIGGYYVFMDGYYVVMAGDYELVGFRVEFCDLENECGGFQVVNYQIEFLVGGLFKILF